MRHTAFVLFLICSSLINFHIFPTRSRGISLSSAPYFKNTFPAVCCGLMPIPSSVIMAVVAGDTLNSSAANFNTAVNGVLSGTLNLKKIIRGEKRSFY